MLTLSLPETGSAAGRSAATLPRPRESCRVKDQKLAPVRAACISDFPESLQNTFGSDAANAFISLEEASESRVTHVKWNRSVTNK